MKHSTLSPQADRSSRFAKRSGRRGGAALRQGPRLAIIGAPNVGKSTLFNRLIGRPAALVDDRPGVTRDCKELIGRLGDIQFPVIDTGGLGAPIDVFGERIGDHALAAARQAELVLFLIDGSSGISHGDRDLAAVLHRHDCRVIVGVNKCDRLRAHDTLDEIWELGFGAPIALSATHGIGMASLYDYFDRYRFDEEAIADGGVEEEARPLRIAVLGRPNVGKSTLINRLLGETRLITGPEPGITRDAVEIPLDVAGTTMILIDTAGIRRKARVHERLETLSVGAALTALRFCDVALLLMSAGEAFEVQERRLAARIVREKRGLVIGLNKCDQISDPTAAVAELRHQLDTRLSSAGGASIIALSALHDHDFAPLLQALESSHQRWNSRISTGILNRWLANRVAHHQPPSVTSGRPRLRYMTQIKTRPPTFLVFCSRSEGISEAYVRYLEAGLRQDFAFAGASPQVLLRNSENPYVTKTAAQKYRKPPQKDRKSPQKDRKSRVAKAPVKISKARAPVKSAKVRAPVIAAKAHAPVKAAKARAPVRAAKARAPVRAAKARAPVRAAKARPVRAAKAHAPVKAAKARAPVRAAKAR